MRARERALAGHKLAKTSKDLLRRIGEDPAGATIVCAFGVASATMTTIDVRRRYPLAMATVVVLNGTSSAGKTTMARAFQQVAPRIFLNFSIDSILTALPRNALDRITSGADISDLRFSELVRGFYACVRELLALGHDLVIDHAMTARYHVGLLLAATEGHEVLLVGLDCPPEVLRQRERERGDRRIGMAEQQRSRIHSWLEYDLFFDTSAVSAEQAAGEVVRLLDTGGGAIERIRGKLGDGFATLLPG
jgi:chloramphenicol 3-O phosphotransferase